jgi:DnaJ-class molecular chaperone
MNQDKHLFQFTGSAIASACAAEENYPCKRCHASGKENRVAHRWTVHPDTPCGCCGGEGYHIKGEI